jgi:sterol desaturase/sphingolipid hydroxylase (fatty acid hydroxylase superfamily)
VSKVRVQRGMAVESASSVDVAAGSGVTGARRRPAAAGGHANGSATEPRVAGKKGTMVETVGALEAASAASSESTASTTAGYALTRKVLAHHNQPNNAWVAYRGGVYDVTTFLEAHPGGAHVLEGHLGTDVTAVMTTDVSEKKEGPAAGEGKDGQVQDLTSQRLHAHSPFAFKLLEKHRIGTLVDAEPGVVAIDGNVDPDTGKELVRWGEPILHQVGMLGDKYSRWIHSFPTTDHTVKMFTNDTIENLTKCPWYVPLLFWIPITLLELVHFVYLVGGTGKVNVPFFLAMALCGGVSWLLFEYALHRWVFHLEPSGYWANIGHFLIHGHHHITPMDFDRLVFPPVPALLVGGPFWVLAPRLLGVQAGYPWLIGFLIGYLVYDMTHFWIHHGVPSGVFLKMQKRRHIHHHYFKPSVNFGISNPLFDVVFSTLDEPK